MESIHAALVAAVKGIHSLRAVVCVRCAVSVMPLSSSRDRKPSYLGVSWQYAYSLSGCLCLRI